MKPFLRITLTAVMAFATKLSLAQGVAINNNGDNPDSSAILDLTSTTKGVLIPRMTGAQKAAIVLPVAGLMIYQTDSAAGSNKGFYYYDGSVWMAVGSSNNQWVTKGNNLSNYNTGNIGIGTTNPKAKVDINTTDTFGLSVKDNTNNSVAIMARDSGVNSTGVYGYVYSSNGIGVRGFALYGTGVGGATKYGNGVVGSSSYGAGGYFTSVSGSAGYFSSGTGSAITTDEGRVGIGTTAPGAKMEIDAADTFGLIVKDNTNYSAGIYVKDSGLEAYGIYGRMFGTGSIAVAGYSYNGTGVTGAVKFGTGVKGSSSYGPGGYFSSLGNYALVTEFGNVGIGTLTPVEQLDVNGGIHLGNTTAANAGTIRFDGTNFQGYNGTGWTSFGAGSGWSTSGTNIYNGNTGNVGIGTNAPATKLDIKDSSVSNDVPSVRISQVNNVNYTGGGAYDAALDIAVSGSSNRECGIHVKQSGGFGTAIIIDSSLGGIDINTYNTGMQVSSQGVGVTISSSGIAVGASSTYGPAGDFNSDSGYALITARGNVGIGQLSPVEQLDVNGGIRVGNTATTHAGTIRYDGSNFQGYNGTGWANFGSSTSPWTTSGANIYKNNSGNVGIGTATPSVLFNVVGNNSFGPLATVQNGASSTISAPTVQVGVFSTLIDGDAVVGHSDNNIGVKGATMAGSGVYASSQLPFSFGLYATTNNGCAGYFGVSGTGTGITVLGGKSGFGTSTPQEMVDVNGGVKVGNTTSSNAGTIRFNGANFQGYNGTSWITLGSGSTAFNDTLTRNLFTSGYLLSADGSTGVNLKDNGTIVDKGVMGSGSDLTEAGAGSKMIWYPKKAAFRAGATTLAEWDNSNIGSNSIAMGYAPVANGNNTIAFGTSADATGDNSVAIGNSVNTYGHNGAFAMGDNSSLALTNNDADNQMMMRFAGGYKLYTNSAASQGVQITSGGVAKYLTNVSGSYDARSLVDKRYVDSVSGSGGFNDTLTRNLYTNGFLVSADGSTGINMKDNGQVVDKGTLGAGSDLTETGAGAKLIWYPKKAAFRAGASTVTGEWNNSNIGNYSIALGYAAIANGNQSVALGTADATGDNSFAFGNSVNTFGHAGAFALGDNSAVALTNNDADNQMMMRFAGGYKLYSNSAATQGVQITSGGVAKYLNNLAGSYDSRSLVDKNYVDSSLGTVGGGPWTTGTNISNTNTGKISINTTSTTNARVLIQDNTLGAFNDVLDVKTYNNYSYAIKGEDMTTSSAYAGVYGTTNVGDGVKGLSNGAGNGMHGISATGVGVYGTSNNTGGTLSAGGYFEGYSGSPALITGSGNVGVGTNYPSAKLEICGNQKVNGNIQASGTITASAGITCPSDIRYKKDVTPLDNALANVMKMRGVSYYWKQDEFPSKEFTNDKQIGVIAQEVEKIYPELVFTDKDGYKTVDYTRLAPILLEAIKAQQQEIESLKANTLVLTKQAHAVTDLTKRMELMEASLTNKDKEGVSAK